MSNPLNNIKNQSALAQEFTAYSQLESQNRKIFSMKIYFKKNAEDGYRVSYMGVEQEKLAERNGSAGFELGQWFKTSKGLELTNFEFDAVDAEDLPEDLEAFIEQENAQGYDSGYDSFKQRF